MGTPFTVLVSENTSKVGHEKGKDDDGCVSFQKGLALCLVAFTRQRFDTLCQTVSIDFSFSLFLFTFPLGYPVVRYCFRIETLPIRSCENHTKRNSTTESCFRFVLGTQHSHNFCCTCVSFILKSQYLQVVF